MKREPMGGLHRQSSTEDNARSFSKPDTVRNDAAGGTVVPPGQTEVVTLRLFSAPLGTRDGGPEPLDSTLRRQNMVDHVTHHEMEHEKRRRHLELQEFTRKQMKEKEQAPRTTGNNETFYKYLCIQ